MSQIVIFGATSGIAQHCARLWASHTPTVGSSEHEFVLCGRRADHLEALAKDLRVRGAKHVQIYQADLMELSKLPTIVHDIHQSLGRIDIALIAHGSLPNQIEAEISSQKTLDALTINFLSPVLLLTELSQLMQKQNFNESGVRGSLAVISSVAGDRGRASNYVYGTGKGALTVFLQGLRNRLSPAGIHVITIKPGFVATPMTAHMPQGPLFVQPEVVARDIVKALGKQQDVLYTPWFWKWIMLVICLIPERIFKRLRI